MKPKKMWAVFKGDGILSFTIRETESDAIFEFEREEMTDWGVAKFDGYELRRVTITEGW